MKVFWQQMRLEQLDIHRGTKEILIPTSYYTQKLA